MQRYCQLAVALSLLFVASPLWAADPDMNRMQGKWEIVSAEMDAERYPQFKGIEAQFRGNRILVKAVNSIQESTFQIDSSATPKQINTTQRGVTMQGIYVFEGNFLKICLSLPGKPRPADFTTSAGSGRTLYVYERSGL